MSNLKVSFENVAEWCERHLEDQRGREIGMTFGTMLRVYGRLATLSSRLDGEQRTVRIRQLNANAEKLLMELSKKFLVAYGYVQSEKSKLVEPMSVRTNMIYDPGPRPKE